MPSTDQPLSYPSAGHEDWLSRVNDRADGLTIEAIDRQALAGFRGLPEPTAGPAPTSQRGWQAGAYVDSGSNAAINAYAKEELAGGAEALLFRLYRQPRLADLATILQDIPADGVSLHCSLRYPGQDPAELFRDLVRYLRKEQYDLAAIEGSVDFDPLLDWSEPPFPPLIRLLYFVARWMPGFRVLQVNAAGFNNGIGQADVELALAIAKGTEYLRQLEARRYPAALAVRHLKFAFTVGTSLYGDIAKLRAFRILWAEALAGMGIENAGTPLVSAHSDMDTMTGDREANQRNLTFQALAAIHGGADLVFLAPAEGMDRPPSPEGRQIALGIQQKLRHADAALLPLDEAYLSTLTAALTAATRGKLANIAAQGGFAHATEI